MSKKTGALRSRVIHYKVAMARHEVILVLPARAVEEN